MIIIGCDFHTRYQQIAMVDESTGEWSEGRLEHEHGEARSYYRALPKPVRVGVEATGPLHWFERMLAELGHELWIGDSAKIRASEVRKQKTDERDARLILDLMLTHRFPRRVPQVPDVILNLRVPHRRWFCEGGAFLRISDESTDRFSSARAASPARAFCFAVAAGV